MGRSEVEIWEKIKIVQGNIIKMKADVIVNAAKPTLMGGSGVDGAIHRAISGKNDGSADFFASKIREELDKSPRMKEAVRCEHGHAVITEGYGLCQYVVHAVGPRWSIKDDQKSAKDREDDKKKSEVEKQQENNEKEKHLTSKCRLDLLKSCYNESLKLAVGTGARTIALPVISSGSYGFPPKLAAHYAIVSICNFLIELKRKDFESYSGLSITIVTNAEKMKDYLDDVLEKNRPSLQKEQSLYYLTTWESHRAYAIEVKQYDKERRGLFGLYRWMRCILVFIDVLSINDYWLRGWLERAGIIKSWTTRRQYIEITVLLKLGISIVLLTAFPHCLPLIRPIFLGISAYLLLETLLYLAKLLLLADIQNPSASGGRSLLLLLFNYLEIHFDFALFYLAAGCIPSTKGVLNALYIAFTYTALTPERKLVMGLIILQSCIVLYFVGIGISYFISALRPREFVDWER